MYLDNGACYSGDILALLCARLDICRVHAAPYDPEARGKMEWLWQTARGRCLDHLHPTSTRTQVDLALWSWLDADDHRRKHGSLMGKTPREVYREGSTRRPLTALELARALAVELTRKVGKDGTFSVDAVVYEVDGRHLATRSVTVIQDGLTGKILRVTHDERPVRFGLCDAVMNARRRRAPELEPTPLAAVPFDPIVVHFRPMIRVRRSFSSDVEERRLTRRSGRIARRHEEASWRSRKPTKPTWCARRWTGSSPSR